MPPRSEILIADTSCLILLNKIEELTLLERMGAKILITPEIHSEYGHKLPTWINVVAPKDNHYQKVIETQLDKGEASAFALSLEFENAVLIIDDLKARKLADALNIRYTGTFGLFLSAKKQGIIKSVKPIIEKIEKTNFRFSENLMALLLKEAGE